ncbi:hypothetical protein TWF281_011271 [Arthrobotrys megalospora]
MEPPRRNCQKSNGTTKPFAKRNLNLKRPETMEVPNTGCLKRRLTEKQPRIIHPDTINGDDTLEAIMAEEEVKASMSDKKCAAIRIHPDHKLTSQVLE